jgi:hypothetical protein
MDKDLIADGMDPYRAYSIAMEEYEDDPAMYRDCYGEPPVKPEGY